MATKKNMKRLNDLLTLTDRRYGQEAGSRIRSTALASWDRLTGGIDDFPPALHRHLKNNIFPAMALFDGLLAEGGSREEAAQKTDEIFSACMEKPANMIRSLCKIPGLYKKLPLIWKKAAFKLFGPEAGFRATMYDTPKSRVKFDMTACPYFETCKQLGYPEIAFTFCHTDDICYGNMHPKLKWNRTKTIARGGDCCDFDLYVEK